MQRSAQDPMNRRASEASMQPQDDPRPGEWASLERAPVTPVDPPAAESFDSQAQADASVVAAQTGGDAADVPGDVAAVGAPAVDAGADVDANGGNGDGAGDFASDSALWPSLGATGGERTQLAGASSGASAAAAVAVAAAGQRQAQQLAYSTFLSLLVVLVLIATIRFTVPPLVESLRYSWYRGQLRAEYEVSGQQLKNVGLSSLSEASELVSRRVGPSVVHINLLKVFKPKNEFLFGGDEERFQITEQGSGVILDTQGHILTNQHVIEGAGRIEVSLGDGRRLVARVIGNDPATDLAVIKVDADGLLPVEWGDSNKVDVGTPVWAVGSPFGLERTVTFGILSSKHRVDLKGTRNDYRGTTTYGDLMQSDVAVNPGNSGGPLVNASGQIVGINTAIVGDNYIGISFAIPSNVAKRVAAGLVGEGEVARGWLGVRLSDPLAEDDSSDRLPLRGALVDRWTQMGDSPAKAAGILPGDLIVKFAGEDVTSSVSLMSLVAQADVGTTVPVEVIRGGQPQTLQVEIGRRPKEANAGLR
jgi:S1-C subfamily serine protease